MEYATSIREQLRALEKRRGMDPDVPTFFLDAPKIYVAYQWSPRPTKVHRQGHWLLLGFVRARSLHWPRIVKIRHNFKLAPNVVMTLVDLHAAAKNGGPSGPPHQYNPLVSRRWLNKSLRART